MYLKRLALSGFRNYENAEVCFSPGINVITGRNAQGKTNLLEAVFCMTCGKSFRARSDRELIRFGADFAEINAVIVNEDRELTLTGQFPVAGKKRFFVNGAKLRTLSELRGYITAVLFCPDDLRMIKEGAQAHRRLMDAALFQLRPRYAAILGEYTKLYEHKCRILRDWREKPSMLESLDDYNIRLAKYGTELLHYRAQFISALSKKAGAIHSEFSGGSESLEINYRTVKTVTDPLGGTAERIFSELMEHQAGHRSAEIESGLCLSGVHKDDLDISINGRPARAFGSQGQIRTAALSVKLAEREIHRAESGEYPILLLDDVLSELDAKRQSFVLNRITDGQVLITCCEDDGIKDRTGGRVATVDSGRILQ